MTHTYHYAICLPGGELNSATVETAEKVETADAYRALLCRIAGFHAVTRRSCVLTSLTYLGEQAPTLPQRPPPPRTFEQRAQDLVDSQPPPEWATGVAVANDATRPPVYAKYDGGVLVRACGTFVRAVDRRFVLLHRLDEHTDTEKLTALLRQARPHVELARSFNQDVDETEDMQDAENVLAKIDQATGGTS